MSKTRMMGAGLAGSLAHSENVNGNQGGGNKKQGLAPTTNKPVQFILPAIQNRAYGENRNLVFCMNQLGGVGAAGIANNSRMFATTADGVKDCVPTHAKSQKKPSPPPSESNTLNNDNINEATPPSESNTLNNDNINEAVQGWFGGSIQREIVRAQFGNISDWDVSSVTDMSQLFNGLEFDFSDDIRNWDVSSVTDMSQMFESSDFNQDIGSWDTRNVLYMEKMFYYADQFNQNISSWCVTNITSEPDNFADNSALSSSPSYKPVWGSLCPLTG